MQKFKTGAQKMTAKKLLEMAREFDRTLEKYNFLKSKGINSTSKLSECLLFIRTRSKLNYLKAFLDLHEKDLLKIN